jgi:alpha/beta hydrolase family protein
MKTIRQRTAFSAVLLALAAHIGGVHAQSASDVQTDIPVPQVSGPVPVSAESHSFGAAAHTLQPQDLAQMGYIEEEYFISGQANVYDWPERGTLTVRTADVPYTTRVLVRRPVHAERFSGNVVVEMLNPSNLFDLNIGWAMSHTQMLRNGDAWVGITAKPIAVETLKQFDAERYADLSWANPLAASDPLNCEVSRDTTQATENGLVWDIHSQVAAWLRSANADNPFVYDGTASAAEMLYA